MAVAQVSNVLGCVNPIQKITEMAHRDGAVFAPVPQKFEAGTVNAAGAVGLAAAIRYLQEKGFDSIQKKRAGTDATCYGRTRRAAVRSYPRFQRSGQPHGHRFVYDMMFYNTPEEIDALIESVSTIRRRMGYGE